MALKSAIALLIASMLLAFCAYYYHGEYKAAAKDLQLATDTIKDMQTRQRDVAILDAKYTKELSDAKETIDQLQSDVASGAKRLRIKAICVSKATTTGGMGDGGTPELAESSRKDYYDLLGMIKRQKNQVLYLQEYINGACLK